MIGESRNNKPLRGGLSAHDLLGLLNAEPPRPSTRIAGVLFCQSLHQRTQRAQTVAEIREDLARKGIDTPGPRQAWLIEKIDAVADWLVESSWKAIAVLPSLPLPGPPLVGAAEALGDAPGQDAVVLLRCTPPEGVPNAEAFDVERYAEAIRPVVGESRVHIVDGGNCHFRFVKSLAIQTPYAVALNRPIYGESEQASIDALADFFLQQGYPVQFIEIGEAGEQGINLANVHWSPAHDLLVLAESPQLGRMPAGALPRLVNTFGKPGHVLHAMLRIDGVTVKGPEGSREPMCYQLNMLFHRIRNSRGEWVALLHERCVFAVHWLHQDGRVEPLDSMTGVLQELGFTVVSLSANDMKALAGCVFSSEHRPGVLVLNGPISAELRSTLRKAGVSVRVPKRKDQLGNTEPPFGAFGIDSMVVQVYGSLSIPDEPDEPGAEDPPEPDAHTPPRSEL